MTENSTATATDRRLLLRGLAWGGLGVLAFSLSLPTTQVAVRELGPTVATAGRAVGAALLAAAYLLARGARLPSRDLLPGLVVVVLGVVVGFPLLTALALRTADSSRSWLRRRPS